MDVKIGPHTQPEPVSPTGAGSSRPPPSRLRDWGGSPRGLSLVKCLSSSASHDSDRAGLLRAASRRAGSSSAAILAVMGICRSRAQMRSRSASSPEPPSNNLRASGHPLLPLCAHCGPRLPPLTNAIITLLLLPSLALLNFSFLIKGLIERTLVESTKPGCLLC